MTVLEVIQKSADFLVRKGVDSPRLQSELLLAHVLGTERLKLYLQFDRVLNPEQLEQMRELVRRRGTREPLQHILGSTSFCGLDIQVNQHVLIPRPETELLAEEGWKYLQSLKRPGSFLDFGTGSGCIAIALARFAPGCSGLALDIAGEALEVARVNAANNQVAEQVEFVQGNGFEALRGRKTQFDLLIANPPYIPSSDIPGLQEEVRQFDPHGALDGGADGLSFYRLLAQEGRLFLRPGGKLMAEFGDGQEGAIAAIFEAQGWSLEQILKDYHSKPRILITVHRES